MERFAWATPERVSEMDDRLLAVLIEYDAIRQQQDMQTAIAAAGLNAR